jgi:hypothetical protein
MRGSLERATAFGLALALALGSGCERGSTVVTAQNAPPLQCPAGASVQRVEFPEDRGGGFAERCVLADGSSRHGPSREWDAEGRQRGITHWWQGMRHGKTVFWYPDGSVSNEAQHYRWQPTGVWTAWDESGAITDRRDFGPPDPHSGSWPMPELGPPADEPATANAAAPPPAPAGESATPAGSATAPSPAPGSASVPEPASGESAPAAAPRPPAQNAPASAPASPEREESEPQPASRAR